MRRDDPDHEQGHSEGCPGPLNGEDRIRQGIREGWITPPRSTEPPRRLERAFRMRTPMTIQEILDEDRGNE